MLRIKRITIGIMAVLLGVSGALLPFVPGWPFFLLGVFVLSHDVPPMRPVRRWLEMRYPKLRGLLQRWESRLGLANASRPH